MQDANSIPELLVTHFKNENSFIKNILGYGTYAVKHFLWWTKE